MKVIFGLAVLATSLVGQSVVSGDSWLLHLRQVSLTSQESYGWGMPSTLAKARSGRNQPSTAEASGTDDKPKPRGDTAAQPPKTISSADPTSYYWDGHGWRVMSPKQERAWLEFAARDFREDMGAFNLARTQPAEARNKLIGIIRRRPYDDQAASELAEVCNRLGRYDEALAVISPQLGPNSRYEVRLHAALSGAMTGRLFEGQKEFTDREVMAFGGALTGTKTALPLGDTIGSAKLSSLMAMGSSYAMKGDQDTARLYFERARGLSPNNPFVEFSLGQIYLAKGERENARAAYELAADHGTGDIRLFGRREADRVAWQIKLGSQMSSAKR